MSFICSRIPSRISQYIQFSYVFSLLLAVAVSQTFLVFNDLDIFEEYWLGILQDAPLLEFFFLIYFLAALGLHCCTRAFSSCGEGGLFFIAVRGLLIVVASLVAKHRLQARGLQQLQHLGSVVAARRPQSMQASVVAAHGLSSCGARALQSAGFSSCGTWAQQLLLVGSRAWAQQLWRTGLVAPRYVGSSWIRDQTSVPCIGRWILNCWTTREVPTTRIFLMFSYGYMVVTDYQEEDYREKVQFWSHHIKHTYYQHDL